jgi:glycerol kinase
MDGLNMIQKIFLSTTIGCINSVIKESGIDSSDLLTAGITNQRETVVAWNKKTGEPVYNAIVWQDRRTEDACKSLKEQNYQDIIQIKTGLIIDPYFTASKIQWILENVDEARLLMSSHDLIVGTIDSWLIWNLTNKESHVTDATNASRTMIYNINEDRWDDELLSIFKIPKEILPTVKNSMDDFGNISKDFFGHEISICGVAGDQQAAAFGQLCFEKGMVKSTYGTWMFHVNEYWIRNKSISKSTFINNSIQIER